MVTLRDLSQYSGLKKECADLEARIKRMQDRPMAASDTVQGSWECWPFIPCTVTIHGIDEKRSGRINELYLRLAKKRGELADKCAEIEAYIESVNDAKARLAIRLYYIDGLTWRQVSSRLYGHPGYEDAIRKRIKRLF